jgi:hypothetical protein
MIKYIFADYGEEIDPVQNVCLWVYISGRGWEKVDPVYITQDGFMWRYNEEEEKFELISPGPTNVSH